jgi:hypothetical protein
MSHRKAAVVLLVAVRFNGFTPNTTDATYSVSPALTIHSTPS